MVSHHLRHLVAINTINIPHRTIFGRAEPILATKFGPPGPILGDQKWSYQTVFFPDQNFCYRAISAELVTRTIFDQAGPLLVTKIGPARPFLDSQEWSGQTIFSSKFGLAGPFLPGPFFL